jgi:predicted AAA+ superfamily ATPase
LKKKQIIAITGLRRTGKSTLMRQAMLTLGKDATYFSFDEEETQKKDTLVFIIEFMIKTLKAKYIFLDELHYVEDWEGILKRYYDQSGVKFVISGSESMELDKARPSLAGRMASFMLEPLSFREYLLLRGMSMGRINMAEVDKSYEKLLTEKEKFEQEFTEYIYKGAFPELINETDEQVIIKYIQETVVRKIIYRDIPRIYEIRRRDLLYDIMRYACENSASLFDVRNLCGLLKADFETVSSYIFYIKAAFLIKTSESYSRSPATRMRRNKKIYPAHPSIALAVMGYRKEFLVGRLMGQFVESAFAKPYFWRDKQKNEVDAVLTENGLVPIEVKYRNSISQSDLKGIIKFMEKYESPKGYVATKDIFEKKRVNSKEIWLIPAWFLMLVLD